MKPKTAPPAGTSTPVRQRTGAVSKSGDYTHFIFMCVWWFEKHDLCVSVWFFSIQLAKINNIPRLDGADTHFPEEHSRQHECLHSHNLYNQT